MMFPFFIIAAHSIGAFLQIMKVVSHGMLLLEQMVQADLIQITHFDHTDNIRISFFVLPVGYGLAADPQGLGRLFLCQFCADPRSFEFGADLHPFHRPFRFHCTSRCAFCLSKVFCISIKRRQNSFTPRDTEEFSPFPGQKEGKRSWRTW